jgi:SAM-dependent methyltransferase
VAVERLQREREFHDQAFAEGTDSRLKAVSKFYSVSTSFVYYRKRVAELSQGGTVLEYGCGVGSMGFELARSCSAVTGIDISGVAIERARSQAAAEGIENLSFLEMNAEDLHFESDHFDFICGSAILHHLDLGKAYSELARVLHARGAAVFVEPLGHNPFISLYRRLTPRLRTEDEHPLLMKDLELAERYFGSVRLRFFQLLTLLAVPFRNSRFIRPLRRSLDATDQTLFRIFPPARKHAWQVVIELAEPRKGG